MGIKSLLFGLILALYLVVGAGLKPASSHHCLSGAEEREMMEKCLAEGYSVQECEAQEPQGPGHYSGAPCEDDGGGDDGGGDGNGGSGGGGRDRDPEPSLAKATLENPQPRSTQSGIGVISGWVCEAEEVEILFDFDPHPYYKEVDFEIPLPYGSPRDDTAGVCGDYDNGFGLLLNWNTLGDGRHAIALRVDGNNRGWSVFYVVTLGQEFLLDASEQVYVLGDFPFEGEAVEVEWSEALQNFRIIEHTPLIPSPLEGEG